MTDTFYWYLLKVSFWKFRFPVMHSLSTYLELLRGGDEMMRAATGDFWVSYLLQKHKRKTFHQFACFPCLFFLLPDSFMLTLHLCVSVGNKCKNLSLERAKCARLEFSIYKVHGKRKCCDLPDEWSFYCQVSDNAGIKKRRKTATYGTVWVAGLMNEQWYLPCVKGVHSKVVPRIHRAQQRRRSTDCASSSSASLYRARTAPVNHSLPALGALLLGDTVT